MTYNVHLTLLKKGLLSETQRIKVRQQNGAPRTDLGMFARSKQTFANGTQDRAITLTELHKEGNDVVQGVLVKDNTIRKYGQFAYKQITEDENGKKLDRSKRYYDYSKKIPPARFPLDNIVTTNIFNDSLDDVSSFVKRAIKSKYTFKRLYTMYKSFIDEQEKVQKELEFLLEHDKDNIKQIKDINRKLSKKFMVDLRCYVTLISDNYDEEGFSEKNYSILLPKIHIKKVFQNKNDRVVPNFEELEKDAEKVISKSFIYKHKGTPITIDYNGKPLRVKEGDNITFTNKQNFKNLQPLMVDEYTYDVFIDKNTLNKIQNQLDFLTKNL